MMHITMKMQLLRIMPLLMLLPIFVCTATANTSYKPQTHIQKNKIAKTKKLSPQNKAHKQAIARNNEKKENHSPTRISPKKAHSLLEKQFITPDLYQKQMTQAILRNDVKQLRLLIDAGADVNYPDLANGMNSHLKKAVAMGHTECVKMLIDAGADVNKYTKSFVEVKSVIDPSAPLRTIEWSTINIAASLGRADELRLLIDAGAHLNSGTSHQRTWEWAGNSPLHSAVFGNHAECVKILLDAGAPADRNAICAAVFLGRVNLLKMMLKKGAILEWNDKIFDYPALYYEDNPFIYTIRKQLAETVYVNVTRGIKLLLSQPDASKKGWAPIELAIYANDVKKLKSLLADGVDPNFVGRNHCPMLCLAICLNHIDCVKELLKAPTIDTEKMAKGGLFNSKYNALFCALHENNEEAVKLLLNSNAKYQLGEVVVHSTCTHTDIKIGSSALNVLAETGNVKILKMLIAKYGKKIFKGQEYSALSKAASVGHAHYLKYLLQFPELKDPVSIQNAIVSATYSGKVKCLRMLLAVDPNIKLNGEYTRVGVTGKRHLLNDAMGKYPETVKMLLNAAGEKLGRGSSHCLFSAAQQKDPKVIKAVLNAPGFEARYIDSLGYIFDLAVDCQSGPEGLMAMLKKEELWNTIYKSKEIAGIINLICATGYKECIDEMYNIWQFRRELSEAEDSKPLCSAAARGHTEVIERLLKMPEVYAEDEHIDGKTPLYFAAAGGHNKALKFLLSKRIYDINKESFGTTPLSAAAALGHFGCVKALLEEPGIDVHKGSPLIQAASCGHAEVVKLLLANNQINVNAEEKTKGFSIIRLMANSGKAIQLMTLNGTSLTNTTLFNPANGKDEIISTALSKAAAFGDMACVKLLLQHEDIDVNKGNALCLAASHGHTQIVKLLLNTPGIDINQELAQGVTPLYLAAACGHTQCVELLLQVPGVQVNKPDCNGCTPIMFASMYYSNESMLKTLMKAGADPKLTNNSGKNALNYAKDSHWPYLRILDKDFKD